MIIIDYSFTNTGGGGGSCRKGAVHSIKFFFKNFEHSIFFKKYFQALYQNQKNNALRYYFGN